MKHPYSEILIAIAEGKEIQWQTSNGKWACQSPAATLVEINGNAYDPERYRIKPATILINGVECVPNVQNGNWPLVFINGGIASGDSKVVRFNCKEDRDAAYAALIKPFESDK